MRTKTDLYAALLGASEPLRTAIRRVASADSRGSRPVIVIDGDTPPGWAGESYYHTTPSGLTIVRHPSAYGWPTLYHASTLRVEVGVDWLAGQVRELLSNHTRKEPES